MTGTIDQHAEGAARSLVDLVRALQDRPRQICPWRWG